MAWSQGRAIESSLEDDVQKVKTDLSAQYESWAEERRKNYEPKWDENIEELSSRANRLLIENQKLEAEQQSLTEQLKNIQADIERQQQANKAIQDEIALQKGPKKAKPDQDPVTSELKELQAKLDENTKELEEYRQRVSSLEKKIKLGELKLTALGVDHRQVDQRLKTEKEIEDLRSRTAEAVERERGLREKNNRLKTSGALDPKVAQVHEEIEKLKAQIAEAQSPRVKQAELDQQAQMSALQEQKRNLLKDVERLKTSVDKIEKAQAAGIAHQRTKALVDEMSMVNMDNDRLKEEMGVLQENIDILKSHIKKLEYKAEMINSMKGNMGAMKDLNNPY